MIYDEMHPMEGIATRTRSVGLFGSSSPTTANFVLSEPSLIVLSVV